MMQEKNNKFWLKVATVGLIAGLIGGGRLYLSCMCGNEQKLMPIDELTGLRIERQAIRR